MNIELLAVVVAVVIGVIYTVFQGADGTMEAEDDDGDD